MSGSINDDLCAQDLQGNDCDDDVATAADVLLVACASSPMDVFFPFICILVLMVVYKLFNIVLMLLDHSFVD